MAQKYTCIGYFTKGGGYYGELRQAVVAEEMEGWIEVHHLPSREAIEASNLYDAAGGKLDDGNPPAILMDYEDHRLTASCGSGEAAQRYRAKQTALLNAGKFDEAQRMDFDDLHQHFGDKYDAYIAQVIEHTRNLHRLGYI
jgi:hypothetical protein